jgi:hypothetical protein
MGMPPLYPIREREEEFEDPVESPIGVFHFFEL